MSTTIEVTIKVTVEVTNSSQLGRAAAEEIVAVEREILNRGRVLGQPDAPSRAVDLALNSDANSLSTLLALHIHHGGVPVGGRIVSISSVAEPLPLN